MEQVFRLLFIGLFGGLSLSLEAEQCRNLYKGGYQPSFCCDTTSGRTCLTRFIATDSNPVRKPFVEASRWCNSSVPFSSLIIIDSLESLRTLERFIESRILAYETIITDAQQLSARDSTEWSWVSGNETIPINVRTEALPGLDGACVELKHGQSLAYCTGTYQSRNRYICEYSESNSTFSYRHNNKSYVASVRAATWYDARNECLRLGGDLASITNLQMIQEWSRQKQNQNQRYWIGLHRNKWIWSSTGAALTYTNWKGGYPDELSDNQCVCVNPQCRREKNRLTCDYDWKWRTCNCNQNYAIVCQNKEETPGAFTTEIVVTGRTLSSTSKDFKASVSLSFNATTSSRSSSSSSSQSSTALSTAKSSPENITITGLFKSFNTKEILLIVLFVAVVFIIVAIILIIRKRRYDRRNEEAYMKNTTQSEAVSPAYTTVVPANRTSEGTVTSDNPIYADVEMTQQPTPPSNNTIYASVQPTIEAVDMGKRVVYADLNFPQKHQQKIRSADKITACLSPIYSQPYEPRTSASNSEYAEPFMPDKRPTATAPVIHHNAAGDQQNIYPLAKAIPLGDPSVIYSEPNKPTKSSTPTDKAVKASDPIYLNVIEVKPRAESEGVATQDPSAVNAEPIKLEKSS